LKKEQLSQIFEKTKKEYCRLHPENADIIGSAELPEIKIMSDKKFFAQYGDCYRGLYLKGGKIVINESSDDGTIAHEFVHYLQDLTHNLKKGSGDDVISWRNYLAGKPDEVEAYAIGHVVGRRHCDPELLSALAFYGYHIAVDLGSRELYVEIIKKGEENGV